MANKAGTGWTGWITFGALLMIFEGIMNIFYGLASLFHANWFVYTGGTTYLLDITGWGWWMILIGMLLGLSGSLLLNGNMFGRIMGVIFATLSILVNLAIFPVAPLWATLALVVGGLVVYAIIAHGGEMRDMMR